MTAREMLEHVAEVLADIAHGADIDTDAITKAGGKTDATVDEVAAAAAGALGVTAESIENVIADIERWQLLDPDARNEATRAA